MGIAWQQKDTKNTYHCKMLKVQKLKVKTQEEDLGWNSTRLSVCSQTQHPLHKIPSFKINLHTNEDQYHIM